MAANHNSICGLQISLIAFIYERIFTSPWRLTIFGWSIVDPRIN